MTVELVSGTPVIGGALGVAAVAVWLSARRDFLLRLLSFAAATPILIVAASTGTVGATALAVSLALICCWEFSRMTALTRAEAVALTGAVVATILLVPTHHEMTLPWLAVACIAVPLIAGGGDRLRQSAMIGWAALWLAAALAQLPSLGERLLPIAVAVSIGDVAAYFGGSIASHAARRHRWCSAKLSGLSPNKTWCGAVAGAAAAVATLGIFQAISAMTVLAVTVGAVVGDLIESMVKRSCGVKDAGTWLPGFGGLLDRVDSLLGALLVVGLFA
jgi:phosphatidate cytidylyltransferase